MGRLKGEDKPWEEPPFSGRGQGQFSVLIFSQVVMKAWKAEGKRLRGQPASLLPSGSVGTHPHLPAFTLPK